MVQITSLIGDVESARSNFLSEIDIIGTQMESWKQDTSSWSVTDVTEHLVWAEQGGILMMWKAFQAQQQGQYWEGERLNDGLTIEDIVTRTWRHENGRPKEEAPASAAPRLGGPLAYWKSALLACQTQLNALGEQLRQVPEHELDRIIYPHVIMGPLNVVQRLEFLRFHLDHHRAQIKRIKESILQKQN
ncbi:hypothetical protein GCM10023187_47460 [Nibrella viscosa]|uniref:DinB-like domain-containing protein n=1 Tax=Nibrella viscosa TaxID=1084524 RepID=A0ABP8KTJ8_9BACT